MDDDTDYMARNALAFLMESSFKGQAGASSFNCPEAHIEIIST